MKHLSTKQEVIGPQEAALYVGQYWYKYQRDVSNRRVNQYTRQMKAGHWTPFSEIVLAQVGGDSNRLHLIDGQHRLVAVIQSGETIPFLVTILQVDTEEELANLYATRDTGRYRGPGVRIAVSGLGDEMELTRYELQQFNAALNFISVGFRPSGRAESTRGYFEEVAMFEEYKETIEICDTILHEGIWSIRKLYSRRPTLAVMLETMRYCPDRSDFWESQLREESAGNDSPDRTLLRFLLMNSLSGGNSARVKTVVSAPYMARYAASCWNAYYRGETLKQARVPNHVAPIVILGTPWEKNSSASEGE